MFCRLKTAEAEEVFARAVFGGSLAFAAAFMSAGCVSAQDTTNFSMVGFDIDLSDAASYEAAISDAIAACDIHELGRGNLACVQQKENGGQLWLGMRSDGDTPQVITINPAFAGKSRFPVLVEGRTSKSDWEPFEYQIAVTFSEFEIPLLVELADPRDASAFDKDGPQRAVMLDLTAFVFRPQVFTSSAAFIKAQAEGEAQPQLESDFFIPSGLYAGTPSAHASFAGEVIEAELMTTRDGAKHWRTLVTVLGGATVNVVFDDIAVKNAPKPGNIIVGDYWLSARVIGQ